MASVRKAFLTGIKLWLVASMVALPAYAFSDSRPSAPDPQAMNAECVKHKIIGANPGVNEIEFLNRDGVVIESRRDRIGKNEMSIQVLGCDADYFFVISPGGSKAKVRRIDVMVDGKCEAALVGDATASNHSTTGFGGC